MVNKDVFKFTIKEDSKEVEKEFLVRLPNKEGIDGGQKIYNAKFRESLDSGAFLRIKLDEVAREQGLWDDDKEVKLNGIQREIFTNEKILNKGGINISQAKSVALKIRELRLEITNLILNRSSLDPKSAEAQAENAQFDYYVSCCLVYNDTGKPYFDSLDGYLTDQKNPLAKLAGEKLAMLMFGDYEDGGDFKQPENKFLKEYGFVDKKLRLINKDGHLVDVENRLIDEDNRFIDENGKFVDLDGNPLDKDGEYAFDTKPFVDDDGNEILPKIDKPVKLTKKKGRPKKVEEVTEVVTNAS